METLTLLDGQPVNVDFMDGVDTTWARVPGGAYIGALATTVMADFNAQNPAASVPALLEIRKLLAALPADILLDEKRNQLDRIIRECLGLTVQTTTPRAEVTPYEEVPLRYSATLRSDVPVRWVGVRFVNRDYTLRDFTITPVQLARGREALFENVQLPFRDAALTQPYWLQDAAATGRYNVANPRLIGTPENDPAVPLQYVFEIADQTLLVPDTPVQSDASAGGAVARQLVITAPVSVAFLSDAGVFTPAGTGEVAVAVTAARAGASGTVGLQVPEGWSVVPATRPFLLGASGQSANFTFSVTAPPRAARGAITAFAETGGRRFDNQRIEVNYPHIQLQLLQPRARMTAASFELNVRGRRVGYVPGAGDLTMASLRQMGYDAVQLDSGDFYAAKLDSLDAVVVGIRAYNVNSAFPAANEALFSFVERGGTLITQYNVASGLRTNQLAPFQLGLSSGRVTNENAAVTFLAPDHPVLNIPNRITSADFTGWVQEQGLYYPGSWDDRFTPILASSDEGEAPLNGALLVARHGRGYFAYTGLSFFRQLPAGVPGAYRLFANLVSLGK
jgi:hypothetical protein